MQHTKEVIEQKVVEMISHETLILKIEVAF